MDMPLTLAISAILLAAAVSAGWMGARPPNPMRGPRLVPWRFLMMLLACGVFVGVVHAVNLLGITTGH